MLELVDLKLVIGQVILWSLWNLFGFAMVEEEQSFWSHVFPGNVVSLFAYFTYFFIQYLI